MPVEMIVQFVAVERLIETISGTIGVCVCTATDPASSCANPGASPGLMGPPTSSTCSHAARYAVPAATASASWAQGPDPGLTVVQVGQSCIPMDRKKTPSPDRATTRPAPGKLAARQEREATALRANLRKRKDQARARGKPKQD